MGFRDYDPESTRYIIPDTAEGNEEEPLSLNKYLYAEGDPINFIDPDGHWIVPLFFGIMNAVQLAEDVVSFAKKPSLKGVAKIGSNFLPGSSGVRKGYKAVKLAKGLVKGAKKAVSSAKNTRIAKKISQTIKKKTTKKAPKKDVGLSSRGYRPKAGERTFNGYIKQNAPIEISLYTKSSKFNNVKKNGGEFKRIGAESHGGVSPHVHQPKRNVHKGDIRGAVGKHTKDGGLTKPSKKDIKQLHQYLKNGKYRK